MSHANIADPGSQQSLSYRFRSRRDVTLREFLLAAKPASSDVCRVADLGGGRAYWERVGLDWLRENGFSVVCVNRDVTELTRGSSDDNLIEIRVGDAINLAEMSDDSFDIIHSNSVIEHLGNWENMSAFAREVRRLAPAYYVQTPYFWFPVDPHFFRVPMIHWMPKPLRARLFARVAAGWAGKAADADEAMRLAESNSMLGRTQMKSLFPDAEFRNEKFLFMTKSLVALRLARSGN